jgi:hypothetical protein
MQQNNDLAHLKSRSYAEKSRFGVSGIEMAKLFRNLHIYAVVWVAAF